MDSRPNNRRVMLTVGPRVFCNLDTKLQGHSPTGLGPERNVGRCTAATVALVRGDRIATAWDSQELSLCLGVGNGNTRQGVWRSVAYAGTRAIPTSDAPRPKRSCAPGAGSAETPTRATGRPRGEGTRHCLQRSWRGANCKGSHRINTLVSPRISRFCRPRTPPAVVAAAVEETFDARTSCPKTRELLRDFCAGCPRTAPRRFCFRCAPSG